MTYSLTLFNILIQTVATFLIGTLFFDILHICLHHFIKSRHPWLRSIGNIHGVHHRFFSAKLTIEKEWQSKNLKQHVIVEYITQLLGIFSCLFLFPLTPVLLASILSTIIFATTCYYRGADPHHRPLKKLPPCKRGMFVDAAYHARHHLYPSHFYSSYFKIFDYVLGSALSLAGKKIAMTGASGALGSQMKLILERKGAIVTTFKYGLDYDYNNYEKLRAPLMETDILFLCHGTKYEDTEKANCDSFVKIIELYKTAYQEKLIPPEIWAVGSEIECHPCFGIKKLYPYANSKRRYAKYARYYFHDPNIQYRHLVHSAFTSKMGRGLMSAKVAAYLTIFLLKRDFKYVPVTYTGFAFFNYLRYVFKPAKPE